MIQAASSCSGISVEIHAGSVRQSTRDQQVTTGRAVDQYDVPVVPHVQTGTSMIANPWRELPCQPPFLLPCDAASVEQFQASGPAEAHRLHLELLLEPFLGRPHAPVVLLNLNAGLPREWPS